MGHAPSLALQPSPIHRSHLLHAPARHAIAGNPLGFAPFLVVNATLFVRPSEILPDFVGWPIFQVLILLCLAVSLPQVIRQLSPRPLRETPITVCVLGLFPAVVLSHLADLSLSGAWTWGMEFLKVVIYYLLLVGLVNTPRRLRLFLIWLTGCAAALTLIAILQFHGILALPNLKTVTTDVFDATVGRAVAVRRLQSTGPFSDPNDMCLILVVGLVLCVGWLHDRRGGPTRLLWLLPLGLFAYALALTQSRGGFLALVAALLVYLRGRFGLTRTIVLGAAILPALFLLFTGRQTSLSASEGTGQERIQLWSDGLLLFRHNPLFGIGVDNYARAAGHVAHNSFLHAFTEMGFFGGMLFLGAFGIAIGSFLRMARRKCKVSPLVLGRLLLPLTAAMAGYVTGMMSLSDCYIMPTYTMLGVATVYLRQVDVLPPLPTCSFGPKLMARFLAMSVVFLAAMYLFVRVMIHL